MSGIADYGKASLPANVITASPSVNTGKIPKASGSYAILDSILSEYSGKVGVNFADNSMSALLDIQGSGNAGATEAFVVRNQSLNKQFSINDVGGIVSKTSGTLIFSTENNNYFSIYKPLAWHGGGGGNQINGHVLGLIELKSYGGSIAFNDVFNGRHAAFNNDLSYVKSAFAVGTENTEPSAAFYVQSSTKGMLAPRMTTNDLSSILMKAEGLHTWSTNDHGPMWYDGTNIIGFRYNSGTSKFQGFDGSSWVDLN